MINYLNLTRFSRRFFTYERNGYERFDGICQRYTDRPDMPGYYNVKSHIVSKDKIDKKNKAHGFMSDII